MQALVFLICIFKIHCMKNTLLLVLCFLSVMVSAQITPSQTDSTLFDFWVGKWDLTWDNSDGTKGSGTNTIERILDGKVIQENFVDQKGFKGTSITVFNPVRKTWHQAWADNQGGYYDFDGLGDGTKRIFKTKGKEINGIKYVQRMVFYDIEKDALKWDWELSKDGGVTWQLQWRIFYKRRK